MSLHNPRPRRWMSSYCTAETLVAADQCQVTRVCSRLILRVTATGRMTGRKGAYGCEEGEEKAQVVVWCPGGKGENNSWWEWWLRDGKGKRFVLASRITTAATSDNFRDQARTANRLIYMKCFAWCLLFHTVSLVARMYEALQLSKEHATSDGCAALFALPLLTLSPLSLSLAHDAPPSPPRCSTNYACTADCIRLYDVSWKRKNRLFLLLSLLFCTNRIEFPFLIGTINCSKKHH